MARFFAKHEVVHPGHRRRGPKLALQWGRYVYDSGSEQHGYRFIWRRPDGSIQARGPARIPALADIDVLVAIARQQGWGGYQGE